MICWVNLQALLFFRGVSVGLVETGGEFVKANFVNDQTLGLLSEETMTIHDEEQGQEAQHRDHRYNRYGFINDGSLVAVIMRVFLLLDAHLALINVEGLDLVLSRRFSAYLGLWFSCIHCW